jgi:hypothetical protein
MADLGDSGGAGGTADGGPALVAGTHVEVRSTLDESWQDGFVVDEVTSDGYRLRREMDGAVLPEVHHDRVRRRRTRSTWWV